MRQIIEKIRNKENLSFDESKSAFEILMSGKAQDQEIFDFLTSLSDKGETSEEIAGGVYILREKSKRVEINNCIDTCGTGGDGMNTLNISTASALVLASMGHKVAKHGNRALSSRSGAADVLTALGVNIECEMNLIEESISHAGFGFMMAPRHHSATRHVAGPRVELATRTIFNVLGPLSNPAGVKKLLVGVFSKKWVEPLAHVLGKLGAEKAWVVHGSDGLDEMTLGGPTYVAEYENGSVSTFECSPADAGLREAPIKSIQG